MPEQLVLGVDVGTSAVRVAVIDPAGRIVASERSARPDSSSGAVFDAELLWEQVVAAIVRLPGALRAGISGIAIAGHVGTVFVDANSHAVGPGRGWADTTGVAELAARYGARIGEVLREVGRPAHTGGAAAAALALRMTDPEEWARVAQLLSPKDFLVARLTGEWSTDATTAAYTSLSAVRERDWSATTLEAAGVDPALLPRQHGSTEIVGVVTAKAAGATGLRAGTRVAAGGPDGTVGATAILGDRSDAVADIAGTTDVLVQLIEDPAEAPARAMLNPYTLGRWSVGGATGMTGGTLARWTALLGLGSVAEALESLEAEIRSAAPGADGLFVDPSLSGSRFPRWESGASGRVVGQRDHHTAAHLIRAVAEAASFVVREGIDLVAPSAEAPVVLAGGVARSRLLSQLRADALGRRILVSLEPDVSLAGAGMLAMLAVGVHASPRDAVAARESRTEEFLPDPEAAAAYSAVFADWQRATDAPAPRDPR